MGCGGFLYFFELWEQWDDGRHGEDFDAGEKLGGQMREADGVKSAGGDFCEEVGTEHFTAIGEINRRGNMARVAIFGLDGGELSSEFGREEESEVFS